MNPPSPQVSIVIPTYGHRAWVRATIDSVLAQTFRDFELIVVNDGSPDDTAALLQPYVADRRIRYVEQRNGGQSSARNHGLRLAQGRFVAVLDDDDLWPVDKLAWQVEALVADETIGVLAGTAQFIDAQGRPLLLTPFVPELTFRAMFRHCPITSPGQTLIRRELLEEAGGFDETVAGVDDWDLWFKLAARSRFVMRDRVALLYRRHDGNMSHQVARLYPAARVVANRHANAIEDPRDRKTARRSAFCGLHTDSGWGQIFAETLKSDIKARRWSHARQQLGLLASLWSGIGGTEMARTAVADVLPRRIKALARRLR